ncbi:unnamed protein product [marine sediment metagenome]|uniref:Uncharacterized protein n=1 Tax=marine sediment metagenome TaxID=412755 RepID=X0XAZ4_9ZZZZ
MWCGLGTVPGDTVPAEALQRAVEFRELGCPAELPGWTWRAVRWFFDHRDGRGLPSTWQQMPEWWRDCFRVLASEDSAISRHSAKQRELTNGGGKT